MAVTGSTARGGQTRARERARAQLADKQAATRAREKANEDDLAAFFTHTETVEDAARIRHEIIAAAHTAYDDTVTGARAEQAGRLHAMRARGETVSELAELTGWSAAEVRAALKTTTGGGDARPTSGEEPGPVELSS